MAGNQVISKERLVDQLRTLGIEQGGVLVVHASFRAVAPVDGGPAALIDALERVLGPSGTLVMPSMTQSQSPQPYDPATTPTLGMGITAETFWRMPGTLRGDHPTSSFAASGAKAAQITAAQSLSPVHGLDSPIGRVYQLGGSILLLGVGHDANTTIHLAESLAEVPYRTWKRAHTLRHGEACHVEYEETDHCCRNFALVEGWLSQGDLQVDGTVGHATARLMRARDVVEVVVPRLRIDPLLFLCALEAGCEDCNEARRSADAGSRHRHREVEAPILPPRTANRGRRGMCRSDWPGPMPLEGRWAVRILRFADLARTIAMDLAAEGCAGSCPRRQPGSERRDPAVRYRPLRHRQRA